MDPGSNSQSNSNSQDPYLILGINEGASFDAIQEARDKKLKEVGDDQITKAKIELQGKSPKYQQEYAENDFQIEKKSLFTHFRCYCQDDTFIEKFY